MAVNTNYYIGGLIASAPAQNRSEQWDSVASTYTAWSQAGTVTTTRALTTAEAAALAAQDATNTSLANTTTIQTALTNHLTQIEAWITANPNGAAFTAAQNLFLARSLAGLCRLLLGITSTTGQSGS